MSLLYSVTTQFWGHSPLSNEIWYVKSPQTAAADRSLSVEFEGRHHGQTLLSVWPTFPDTIKGMRSNAAKYIVRGFSTASDPQGTEVLLTNPQFPHRTDQGRSWSSSLLRASHHWFKREAFPDQSRGVTGNASLGDDGREVELLISGVERARDAVWGCALAPQIMSGSGLFHGHHFTSVNVKDQFSGSQGKNPTY